MSVDVLCEGGKLWTVIIHKGIGFPGDIDLVQGRIFNHLFIIASSDVLPTKPWPLSHQLVHEIYRQLMALYFLKLKRSKYIYKVLAKVGPALRGLLKVSAIVIPVLVTKSLCQLPHFFLHFFSLSYLLFFPKCTAVSRKVVSSLKKSFFFFIDAYFEGIS